MPGDSAYLMLFYPYKHISQKKRSRSSYPSPIETPIETLIKTPIKPPVKNSFDSNASTIIASHTT